jgi:hypothetical protein
MLLPTLGGLGLCAGMQGTMAGGGGTGEGGAQYQPPGAGMMPLLLNAVELKSASVEAQLDVLALMGLVSVPMVTKESHTMSGTSGTRLGLYGRSEPPTCV